MGNRYKHWNDGKYKGLQDPFRTGKLADDIKRDFITFLLNDFDNSNLADIEKRYVGDRFEKMISLMEDVGYINRWKGEPYGAESKRQNL